ncbi:hypothetical protein [Streptomyces javensis]|uniref:Uncharacterized protein n=1 Tax=Streptomyces javensis TaxID=114698 RepID=A0ABS0R4J2_9ACTN|nr:hypothetical protein [Streptomyces javensis]MBI0311647.1 hypothetical protein [Streptomyces javensis]
MTQSTATVPAWLSAAVVEYEQQQLTERANQIMHLQRLAENINSQLNKLGIEPLNPAHVEAGRLRGALLVGPDFDEGTYEVRAFWDETSQQIELHTADWETHNPQYGRVRLLNSIADIAAARHETPKPPAPHRHLGSEALRAIDGLNADRLNNHQVEAIVTAVNGLTAAVLHIGQLIKQVNDRP